MDDMQDIYGVENIDPSGDLDMESLPYTTPSTVGQACWPAARNIATPSTLSDLRDSSFRCESSLFPLPDESPTGLPVRVPLLLPGLRMLDRAAQSAPKNADEGHDSRDPAAMLDTPRDRARKMEALEKLEEHIRQRRPYVALACSRLQAAMRIRNDVPFTLQHVPRGGGPPRPSGGMRSPDVMDVHYTIESARTKSAMCAINPHTGAGLHEFLAGHGYRARRACRSITFHDFTPEMKTGAHRNVLLRHYEASGGRADEIVSYEVDLPTITIHPTTGEEIHGTEPWLWILLKRRLLTIGSNTTSTTVVSSPDPSTPSSSSIFAPRPPSAPHFPLNSASQVVFAAPRAHIVAHAPCVEKMASASGREGHAGVVHRRADFDFSIDGVPVFEFSSAAGARAVPVGSDSACGPRREFLSVEGMGAYDGKGAAWWREFYRRVEDDCAAWKRIREAMGRGKCRIVLRWDEVKGQDEHVLESGEMTSTALGATGGSGGDWTMLDGGEEDDASPREGFTPAAEIIERCVERELGFGTVRKRRGKKFTRR